MSGHDDLERLWPGIPPNPEINLKSTTKLVMYIAIGHTYNMVHFLLDTVQHLSGYGDIQVIQI